MYFLKYRYCLQTKLIDKQPSLNMPSYFFEEGHRAVLHVQDPDEVNLEPQQAAKLRYLGLKRRPVLGDGNCYYYAAAHQLGKLSPDSFDTCTQTRNEIGSYLRSNPNLCQTDIEKLVGVANSVGIGSRR